jgi:protein translocase SecG subunit
MSFLIGFLTFLLVVDCLLLILLVLVQLPKKDAGAGLAFGGGASDALFGAGAGNALTKLTKYVATIFFVLSLGISILMTHFQDRGPSALERELSKESAPVSTPAPSTTPSATPEITPLDPNAPLQLPVTTNVPVEESGTAPETGTGQDAE